MRDDSDTITLMKVNMVATNEEGEQFVSHVAICVSPYTGKIISRQAETEHVAEKRLKLQLIRDAFNSDREDRL